MKFKNHFMKIEMVFFFIIELVSRVPFTCQVWSNFSSLRPRSPLGSTPNGGTRWTEKEPNYKQLWSEINILIPDNVRRELDPYTDGHDQVHQRDGVEGDSCKGKIYSNYPKRDFSWIFLPKNCINPMRLTSVRRMINMTTPAEEMSKPVKISVTRNTTARETTKLTWGIQKRLWSFSNVSDMLTTYSCLLRHGSILLVVDVK